MMEGHKPSFYTIQSKRYKKSKTISRAAVTTGATGAIAPVDFEKGLMAPVDFDELPYDANRVYSSRQIHMYP